MDSRQEAMGEVIYSGERSCIWGNLQNVDVLAGTLARAFCVNLVELLADLVEERPAASILLTDSLHIDRTGYVSSGCYRWEYMAECWVVDAPT